MLINKMTTNHLHMSFTYYSWGHPTAYICWKISQTFHHSYWQIPTFTVNTNTTNAAWFAYMLASFRLKDLNAKINFSIAIFDVLIGNTFTKYKVLSDSSWGCLQVSSILQNAPRILKSKMPISYLWVQCSADFLGQWEMFITLTIILIMYECQRCEWLDGWSYKEQPTIF